MIQADLSKGTRHGATASGCMACHTDHTQPSSAKAGEHYLVAGLPGLCVGCHDTGDVKLLNAHRGQPFAQTRCTRCHDPHASSQAHLMRAAQHEPFARRQCDSCHEAPVNGEAHFKVPSSELCLACHASVRSQINTAPHLRVLAAKDSNPCLGCHDPHASKSKSLVRTPVSKTCRTCHADVGHKEFAHQPVEADCTLCHNPHSAAKNGLRAEGNALCLECHSSASKLKIETSGPIRLFNGQIAVPPQLLQSVRLLDLTNDRGHPVSNHPVLRDMDKDWPAVSCLACHQPHGANKSVPMLVTESESFEPLCQRCHQ